jgi:hypothetical protein
MGRKPVTGQDHVRCGWCGEGVASESITQRLLRPFLSGMWLVCHFGSCARREASRL